MKRFETFLLPDLSSSKRLDKYSPGLDLSHGFIHHIRQHQLRRARQDKAYIEWEKNQEQAHLEREKNRKLQELYNHATRARQDQAYVEWEKEIKLQELKTHTTCKVNTSRSRVARTRRHPEISHYIPPGLLATRKPIRACPEPILASREAVIAAKEPTKHSGELSTDYPRPSPIREPSTDYPRPLLIGEPITDYQRPLSLREPIADYRRPLSLRQPITDYRRLSPIPSISRRSSPESSTSGRSSPVSSISTLDSLSSLPVCVGSSLESVNSLPVSSDSDLDDMFDLKKLEAMKESSRLDRVDLEDVDLDSYVAEAQPYILKAMDDPGSLLPRHLEEVARTIVNRAWEDVNYHEMAARVCLHIFLLEREQQASMSIPLYAFQNGMMETCQELANDWRKMRDTDLHYWLRFVRFLSAVYGKLKVGAGHIKGMANVLYAVLGHLASLPCVTNFDELEVLCSTLHQYGKELQEEDETRMGALMNILRDTFLSGATSPEMRSMILPMIELNASNWQLSQAAKKLYFKS